ncbi:hypothetical protein D3C83_136540 [compost metagenome]
MAAGAVLAERERELAALRAEVAGLRQAHTHPAEARSPAPVTRGWWRRLLGKA